MSGSYHVVPNGSNWQVKKNGRVVSNHRLKRRAVERARKEAGDDHGVQIHRQDGTIQRS